MTEPVRPYSCPPDIVQLEMVSLVPEIEPGWRVTWSSAGKQRFVHRIHPEIQIDDDGVIISSTGGGIAVYEQVPDFKMSPCGISFHPPESYALCILESVMHDKMGQIAVGSNFAMEIFALSTYIEALAVSWPTFDEEHPLELTLYNPMESLLPSFSLSLFLSVSADFAEHWRKS